MSRSAIASRVDRARASRPPGLAQRGSAPLVSPAYAPRFGRGHRLTHPPPDRAPLVLGHCGEHRHGELAGLSREIAVLRDRHQHPAVLLVANCDVQLGPRASGEPVQASRHQGVGVAWRRERRAVGQEHHGAPGEPRPTHRCRSHRRRRTSPAQRSHRRSKLSGRRGPTPTRPVPRCSHGHRRRPSQPPGLHK